MKTLRVCVVLLAWTTLACDRLAEFGDAVASSEPTAERPEGWESLEGDGSSSRLYYQFIDDAGRVRFVERLDEVPEAWRANVGFVKMDVAPPLSPGAAAAARRQQLGGGGTTVAAAGGAGPVLLYSAEWCGACQKAKRHLSRRNVSYQELDVDNPNHAKALVQKTGSRAIPVLDAGGRIFTGFDSGAYDRMLTGV
ncbi:MAG: glutaredoxin family protein [Myxococcota bacterium]